MNLQRIELKKGVSLSVVKTDKFKTNLLTVNLLVPLAKETASHNSLITDVLQRGTKTYPTMQALSKKQEELYSMGLGCYVSKRGETQVITFEMSVIEDMYTFDGLPLLEEGLSLLGGLISDPVLENGVFRADYVEQEKKNLIDSINAQINNKTSYAIRRCHEIMCKGEPFAVNEAGDPEIVAAITPDNLYRHYRNLLETAAIEIFYVGSRDAVDMTELVQKHLGFSPRKANTPETIVKLHAGEYTEQIDKMQISQCKMSIGLRTGTTLRSGDYIKFALFNEVFGGGTSSKLFVNVREKMSLCYYCRPVVEALKGVMVIASGIDSKNKKIAYDAVMQQLTDMQNGIISDTELSDAKLSLANGYREITDSPASVCGWYLARTIAGRSDSPEEAAAALENLTAADLVPIAKRMELETLYYLEG